MRLPIGIGAVDPINQLHGIVGIFHRAIHDGLTIDKGSGELINLQGPRGVVGVANSLFLWITALIVRRPSDGQGLVAVTLPREGYSPRRPYLRLS